MTAEHPSSSALQVFVGRLGSDVTAEEIFEAFALIGVPLARVELVMNPTTHGSRGFAFVAIAKPWGNTAPTIGLLERMGRAVVRERAVEIHALRTRNR